MYVLVPVLFTTMIKDSTTYINPNTCRLGRNAFSHLASRSDFHCIMQWLSSSSWLYIIIKKPQPTSRLGVITPPPPCGIGSGLIVYCIGCLSIHSPDNECLGVVLTMGIHCIVEHISHPACCTTLPALALSWFPIHIHDARSWKYLKPHKKGRKKLFFFRNL